MYFKLLYLGKEIKKKIELYTPLLLLLSKKVTEKKENKYSHNQNNAEWNKALIQNGFFLLWKWYNSENEPKTFSQK